MLRSFTVKNFRCFRELTLAPLERINLIAGKNNSGKTALLEAIHLHSRPKDIELLFLVNERRGTSSERKYDEDSCEWLFFDKKGDLGLELHSQNPKGEPRALYMWFIDPSTGEERYPDLAEKLRRIGGLIGWGIPRWLILKSKRKDIEAVSIIAPYGQGYSTTTTTTTTTTTSAPVSAEVQGYPTTTQAPMTPLRQGYSSVGSSPAPWNDSSVFISSAGRSPKEDVTAFSDVEIANRQDEILPALRILEPRLQRLSIVLLAGQPLIHGHIGLTRLVPVQFMGEGIRRLLSILLAINEASGGNVLIDEIENGLHYSVMVQVWQAIAKASRQANVQVFATTHSWECIRYAHEAFEEDTVYDLRLHRLDRIDDTRSVISYNQEMIESALYNAVEMR